MCVCVTPPTCSDAGEHEQCSPYPCCHGDVQLRMACSVPMSVGERHCRGRRGGWQGGPLGTQEGGIKEVPQLGDRSCLGIRGLYIIVCGALYISLPNMSAEFNSYVID